MLSQEQHKLIDHSAFRAIHVLYHMDTDGRFAGHCAWKGLSAPGEKQEHYYYEVQYNRAFPIPLEKLTKEDMVLIMDFSYSRDFLIEVSKRVGNLVVLDHHKTAADQLKNLGKDLHCPNLIRFDVTKSGALLAFEYFFPWSAIPKGLEYINDRDLWTKRFEESRYVESYIRARIPNGPEKHAWSEWHYFFGNTEEDLAGLEERIKIGKVLSEIEDKALDKFFFSNRHKIVTFEGKQVLVYNCPGHLHSELAERYYNAYDVDYTVGYRAIDGGDTVLFNFRSPSRTNVGAIALNIKHNIPGGLDGGGHENAAGASMKFVQGMEYVAKMLGHI